MKIYKRMLALILALLVAAGCLAGCGGKPDPALEMTQGGSKSDPLGTGDSVAMGRYVEREFPLPEGMSAKDMVMLSTGQLRVAAEDENDKTYLLTTGADRTAWEETKELPGEILDSGRIESLALSPDGTVFCDTILKDEETGDCSFRYWILEPEGTCRELPVGYTDFDPQQGFLVGTCDFTDDGRLFANFGVMDIREVDIQTGSLSEKRNDLVRVVLEVRCGGQDAYLLGMDDCSVLHEGTDAALTGVLQETVLASLQYTMGVAPKVTFCENPDGYLFFTTHEGLYSYIPGGSVVEQLVSGARTTLGDPTFTANAMAVAEDQSFFVIGSGGNLVYHYVYDPDIPTVPSNHLQIYSLYDDEDLRQMISMYQKANPDVAIDLEVGLSGEDGITEADAVRTLNTEILAGDGPDILELDGFSLDTFLKKDLLADVSGAVDQAGPMLDQVAKCYESGGKLCAVPTSFAIPAIYGPGHIVSQIHDLDSLVAASTQAKEENPQQRGVFSAWIPVLLLDQFYDSCSAAWMKEDGTLDEGKLTEFFTAMEALYALDSEMREEMSETIAQIKAEDGGLGGITPGAYTGMGGAIHMLTGNMTMTPGTIDGMFSWAHALGGDDRLDGYETAPIGLQAGNVFLPRRIMGVLNTSENQEYAADFLRFMLSEEAQYSCPSTGFPVNRTAFDRLINEEQELDWQASTSDGSGNHVVVEIHYPDQRHRQQLKGWVENLTTPAMTNRIIRSMVIREAGACLDGEKTAQEAVQAALAALNLYLSE